MHVLFQGVQTRVLSCSNKSHLLIVTFRSKITSLQYTPPVDKLCQDVLCGWFSWAEITAKVARTITPLEMLPADYDFLF